MAKLRQIYMTSDLHGQKWLLDYVLYTFSTEKGVTLIINGDVAGSRGPILIEAARIYYEVKRRETNIDVLERYLRAAIDSQIEISEELVHGSVHNGTFLAYLAKASQNMAEVMNKELLDNLEYIRQLAEHFQRSGGELIIVPGNNEVVPQDFYVPDIDSVGEEETVPVKDRFYNQLAKKGVFRDMGATYVNQPMTLFDGEILLLPIDFVDEWIEAPRYLKGLDLERVKTIVSHHPADSETVHREMKKMMGYSENPVGRKRMKAVRQIVSTFPDPAKLTVRFGHCHKGTREEDILAFERETVAFRGEQGETQIWQAPGAITELGHYWL